MKWSLGIIGVTGALLIGGLFLSNTMVPQAARAEVAQADPVAKATRSLTATGSGSAKATADSARITLKIDASGNDMKAARKALDDAATKLKEVLDGLKLGVEIRPMPVEIAQQNNVFGFGGGGGGFAPVPMPIPGGVPPAFPLAPPAIAPPLPPRLPLPPGNNDNFIAAQLPAAPDAAPVPERAPANPADPPPVPPMGGSTICR